MMYAYLRGPMVWVSMFVFVFGTFYQVVRFFRLSRKAFPPSHVPAQPEKPAAPPPSIRRRVALAYKRAADSVLAVYPITITVSTLFHVCLVILPLFLLGHNELIELSVGVSLPSFSEPVSDALTLIVLLCCAYFLIRRLVVARVRAISSPADYLVLALAALPFLSGLLAYHQIFDYRTMMIIHMLSGELMLMAIPFTKLTHMLFFFLSRFLIINQHTLGKGDRVWLPLHHEAAGRHP